MGSRDKLSNQCVAEDLRPRVTAPAGQTPCTQRKKPSFLFRRCGSCGATTSIGPTMPSSPRAGNLPSPKLGNLDSVFGLRIAPSADETLTKGEGFSGVLLSGGAWALMVAASLPGGSLGMREKARSTLCFHVALISLHFSSVRW